MLAQILQLPGCKIENSSIKDKVISINLRSECETGICPQCEQPSDRVHSYYQRSPSDLPLSDFRVYFILRCRRFRCLTQSCTQKTFNERFSDWLPAYARRTKRLTKVISQTGIVSGGQSSSQLLKYFNIKVSRDTVLRTLRRQGPPSFEAPRVLGVDDWAYRKGVNYGTIIVDLEKRQVIDLFPDRQAETLSAWLKDHQSVDMVARDRSDVYAAGIADGAPSAIQVADRFHLLENIMAATAQVMKKDSKDIRTTLRTDKTASLGDETPILVSDIKITECDRKRMQRVKQAHHLHKRGIYKYEIAERLSISRRTVIRYLALRPDSVILQRRPRKSLIGPFVPYIHQRWQEGCRCKKQLFLEIKEMGY